MFNKLFEIFIRILPVVCAFFYAYGETRLDRKPLQGADFLTTIPIFAFGTLCISLLLRYFRDGTLVVKWIVPLDVTQAWAVVIVCIALGDIINFGVIQKYGTTVTSTLGFALIPTWVAIINYLDDRRLPTFAEVIITICCLVAIVALYNAESLNASWEAFKLKYSSSK